MAQNSHYAPYQPSSWNPETGEGALSLIGKVKIGNTYYELKDAWAREAIGALGDVMNFLGISATSLTDGAQTNPISVYENGSSGTTKSVTAAKGDVVIYGDKEFVWNGSSWAEFGDLAHLAVQTGTTGITIDTGTDNAKTVLTAATLEGTTSSTGAINVGGQQITGAGDFVNSITKVNTIEMGDLDLTPTITSTFAGTAFTSEGSYTPAGTVSAPTFTGSEMTSTGTFVPQGGVSVTAFTPQGTIGTEATGATNYTPTGNITAPTFTGTQGSISVSGTPEGEVTSTFAGTPATITSTFTGTQGSISVSGTPEGSIVEKSGGFSVVTAQGTFNQGEFPTLSAAGTSSFATQGIVASYGGASGDDAETLIFSDANTASAVTTQGSLTGGTLPTLGNATTTAIGFSGTAFTSTGSYTPAGTVVGSYTPEGTITSTFTGTAFTSTGSYTPAGTVSAPTFEGTPVRLVFNGTETTPTASFTGTQGNISVTGTPTGTVSQPEFTGTQATIQVSGTPTGSVTSTAGTIGIQFGTGAISGTTADKYIKFTTTEGTLRVNDPGHAHILNGTSAVQNNG